MKEIPLTQGQFALVDDDDYERLSKHKWYFNHGYASRRCSTGVGKFRILYMHRDIIDIPLGYECDHVDGNKINNQKSNIRKATRSQNNANRRKKQGCLSKYKGVSKNKGKWVAKIDVHNKTVRLGTYEKEEEAAIAYNIAAFKYYGEYARSNEIKENDI
jgi:hypothetical protein